MAAESREWWTSLEMSGARERFDLVKGTSCKNIQYCNRSCEHRTSDSAHPSKEQDCPGDIIEMYH